jgi:hypothetical protein
MAVNNKLAAIHLNSGEKDKGKEYWQQKKLSNTKDDKPLSQISQKS